jgi:hypothetical protein
VTAHWSELLTIDFTIAVARSVWVAVGRRTDVMSGWTADNCFLFGVEFE